MADNELFGNSEQLDDLISRAAAVNEKNVVHMELFGRDFPVVSVATLKGLPPADAVPVVHGEWIDKDGGIATCSVCGDRWGVWSVMKYCPNCGAKMNEEGR